MNKQELDRALAKLAFLAAAIVIAMIAGILTTHISQDFFQSARSVGEFSAKIADTPGSAFGLRLNLGLDNLFVLIYGSFFVLLAVRFRSSMDPWMSAVALGAMLLTVLLDMIENHHIAMMLHAIEHMLPLSAEESHLQMIVSAVKFHSSYLALFLFAFGYCKQGKLGRRIAQIVWLGYLPLGILISVIPVELTKPLAFARVIFFVIAFLLSGVLFMRSAKQPAAEY
ncbi:MAG: hypothetical protein ACXU8A_14325 [Burkholderiaceae bacterium]